MLFGAIGGLMAGSVSEVLACIVEGTFRPARIGIEAGLWGLSLAVGAAAAYGPTDWVGRGLAGGGVFGLVKGGLMLALSLAEEPWPTVMGGEVVGGLIGGVLLSYLWRTRQHPSADG
ncbi:MAG: hypothetical protein BRD55_06150 [Bacteroidetes bacterium SW_9_63_38]|nr:MAG: hypothetical protein BRD55_06150 [Bacteroidetes bacterium SW_9_63_38]